MTEPDLPQIKDLLRKYERGETTNAEEVLLSEFLNSHAIPEAWEPYRYLLNMEVDDNVATHWLSEDLTTEYDAIVASRRRSPFIGKRWVTAACMVAACALLTFFLMSGLFEKGKGMDCMAVADSVERPSVGQISQANAKLPVTLVKEQVGKQPISEIHATEKISAQIPTHTKSSTIVEKTEMPMTDVCLADSTERLIKESMDEFDMRMSLDDMESEDLRIAVLESRMGNQESY